MAWQLASFDIMSSEWKINSQLESAVEDLGLVEMKQPFRQ